MRSYLLLLCLAQVASQSHESSSGFTPCNQQPVAQCGSSCNCQRVACCCGPNCNVNSNGAVNYNRCVDVGSDQSTWNCPTVSACGAYGGRGMTITPCSKSNAQTNTMSPAQQLLFGTTFPMIGTKAVPHTTWQQNVYQGTTMTFNPGAVWDYTDSFNVPSTSTPQYDSAGNEISTGSAESPTPAPDYTGVPCSLANQCPSGYYCETNSGMTDNVQQIGSCRAVPTNDVNGGAGQWTSSSYYTSMSHPPLILDPNHNGPDNYPIPGSPGVDPNYNGAGSYTGGQGGPFGYNTGYGNGYGNNGGYNGNGGYSPPGSPNSCAAPSNCGYKSATGSCWCDSECQSSGDCCPDVGQFCSFSNSRMPQGYSG